MSLFIALDTFTVDAYDMSEVHMSIFSLPLAIVSVTLFVFGFGFGFFPGLSQLRFSFACKSPNHSSCFSWSWDPLLK